MSAWLALEVIALAVTVTLAASVLFYAFKLGIGPNPSNRAQVGAVLDLVAKTEGHIAELGAGIGTLTFALAKTFPQREITAYERSWVPYFVLWLRQVIEKHPNVRLRRENFFEGSLAPYQVLTCYLYPKAMALLASKLREESPGASVVTHTFSIHGWYPKEQLRLRDTFQTPVYRYSVPSRVELTAQQPTAHA